MHSGFGSSPLSPLLTLNMIIKKRRKSSNEGLLPVVRNDLLQNQVKMINQLKILENLFESWQFHFTTQSGCWIRGPLILRNRCTKTRGLDEILKDFLNISCFVWLVMSSKGFTIRDITPII